MDSNYCSKIWVVLSKTAVKQQKIEKLKGESLENFYCKKWKIPVFLA